MARDAARIRELSAILTEMAEAICSKDPGRLRCSGVHWDTTYDRFLIKIYNSREACYQLPMQFAVIDELLARNERQLLNRFLADSIKVALLLG